MRYAIFSDIHANLRAWDAIREDMEAQGAEVLVCLGDVIGYGPLPEQVLATVRGATNNFVLGNHDAAAVGIMDPALFNEHAEAVIRWTGAQLSEDSRQFLLDTPLTIEGEDILFVHAEINEPGRFGYIESADDARKNFAGGEQFITFIGHTHHPVLFDRDPAGNVQALADQDCTLDLGHRYIVNVGSVGEPRNPDDIRARYVLYDSDTRQLWFRRVEFDVEAYRADLAASGLGITPYFLQIVDQGAAAVATAAAVADMRIPTAGAYVQTATRRLALPHPAAGRARPSPIAYRPPAKKKGGPLIVFIAIGLLAAIAAVLMTPPKGEPDTVAEETARPERDARPSERADAVVPKIDPYALAEAGAAARPATPDTQPEPEPAPEPEPVVEPGPLALIFDVGGTFTRYDGANSPAHADGTLPASHNSWISANSDKAGEKEVLSASGEVYPTPLLIEMGAEVLGASDSDAVQWSGPTEASDPTEGAPGIFGSDLMDGVYHRSGKKTIGIRVSGIAPGDYTLYLTPVTGANLATDFRYGVGVDADGGADRIGELEAHSYSGGSATLADEGWAEGENYFKHAIQIAAPTDFVVVLVDRVGTAPGAIPYVQIVKVE